MVALFASPASRAVAQSGYGATIQALVDKTQYITVAGGQMYIRGTNLWIQNGLGATNGNPADPNGPGVTNGLGNLIVGYAELRNSPFIPDVRTGSHNLVLGDFQNYTSYGGMVAGRYNTLAAPYASVSGGSSNTASGIASSVSGGGGNLASAINSSVSGGAVNTAAADSASVSGGEVNTASGNGCSVSGGTRNTASGVLDSVSGGAFNTANGQFCSVSGGQQNSASHQSTSVSGGLQNSASFFYASVSGGRMVNQPNSVGWAAGGDYFPAGGPGIFHAP
jgi:hypothetical protein